MHRGRLAAAALLLLAGLVVACSRTIDEREAVHILEADAQVNPVLSRYIDRGIDEAERSDAKAVVIELDTPGGLVTSMEDIVQRIQASKVPVIVYVSPAGGKAASAGAFITMAGHIAAMAPETRIGAAHPVSATGGDIDGTLGEKIENDAAAYARAIAQERHRNEEWAEDAVRDSVSASAEEAVELDVVDFVATSVDDALAQSEGRTVEVASVPVTLTGLTEAKQVENGMTFFERILMVISDPNIAFLLLTLGGLGLLIELYVPGIGLPGIGGAISLILGLFAVGTLPVNWAGVALILLAFALFAGELVAPGFGVFGIGGAIALMIGGLIMTSSSDPDFQVSRWLIFGMAILIAAFFVMLASAIIKSRRRPSPTGGAALVGQIATARSYLNPEGFVFLKGERWKAVAEGGMIAEGQPVEVVGARGLTLSVKWRPDLPPVMVAPVSGHAGTAQQIPLPLPSYGAAGPIAPTTRPAADPGSAPPA
jgi:membrane-bound serine protease (ClpP class)